MISNLPIILSMHSEAAVAVLRIVVGVILLVHGLPKIKDLKTTMMDFEGMGFRPGFIWGTVTAVLEVVGGAFLVLNILVQGVAFFIIGQFAVIIAWRLKMRSPFVHGSELDFLILAASLVLLTFGGGSLPFRAGLFLN